MAIRWKVPFKSIGGTTYNVNIYDASFSGTATELTGAAHPFVTSDENSNEILKPVRISTGYINIVNTGNLTDLFPTTPKARYVTLTSGNDTLWQGYIRNEQFTQPWDREPYTLQIPVVSALGILEGCQLEKGDISDRARVAEYLRLAIVQTGCSYNNIVFPADLGAQSGGPWDIIFRFGLQDRNWFQYKNQNLIDPTESRYDGMSWLSVLTELMNAFGYTMYEKGKTIYIIGRRRNYYLSIAVSALSTLAANGNPTESSVTSNTITIASQQIAGSNGTVDILPQKRRAVVEGSINPFSEDSTPIANTLYLTYAGMLTIQKQYNGSTVDYYYNKTLGVYIPETGTNIWTFKSYQNGTEQTWNSQDITRDYNIAVYCRDKGGNDMILINYDDTGSSQAWGTGWLCSVKSPSQSFLAGGYISIHACIDFFEGEGGSALSTHRAKFMVRIGNYYYNTSTHSWTTTPTQFSTLINNGNIEAESTEEKGNNDCIYLPVPDSGIYGDVEVYIYNPYSTAAAQTYHQTMYEISKIDVKYVESMYDPYKDEPVTDTNRFVLDLDAFAKEDETKNIAVTSFINGRMGYGVLIKPDFSTPQGKIYDRYAGNIYFEESLTYIINACYQKPQQVLTIPIRRASEFLPTDVYAWNGNHSYLSVEHDWCDEIQKLKIFKLIS